MKEVMTYRDEAIATIKMACQDVIDRVENIIPKDIQGTFDISLNIRIPTMTDKDIDIPSFTISMSSYPARETLMNFLKKGDQANE